MVVLVLRILIFGLCHVQQPEAGGEATAVLEETYPEDYGRSEYAQEDADDEERSWKRQT